MLVNLGRLAGLSLALAASAACAAPIVPSGSVSCVQDAASKLVTVTYTLGTQENQEPAIVTVDFETNVTGTAAGPWVSIGAKNFRRLAGEVNREVAAGTHTITWFPPNTWPNNVVEGANFRATVRAWAKSDPPDYMAIVMVTPYVRWYYECEDALPEGIDSNVYRSDILLMRRIHAAGVTWRMGSSRYEVGRQGGNENARQVTLTKDYYIGVFLFTVAQYVRAQGMSDEMIDVYMRPITRWGWNKVRYNGNATYTDPVTGEDTGLTYPQANGVNKNSLMANIRSRTGIASMDFPTSAQWEYACRADTRSGRFMGDECPRDWSYRWSTDTDPVLDEYAWYAGNSTNFPQRVGLKKPNPWGLYDIYGGLYELCLDWHEDSRPSSAAVDPVGPASGTSRVMRGGAWNCGIPFFRSACVSNVDPRNDYPNDDILGFRLACAIEE